MARRTLSGRIFRRKYQGKESGPYWVEFYDSAGKQHRESSKSERVGDARRLLEQRLGEVRAGLFAGPKAERVTVADLLEIVLADYKANDKRVDFAEACIRRLTPHLGGLAAKRVTTAHLNDFVNARRAEGAANGTINRDLAILRRAFNLGARETPPLVARVPAFPSLREAPPRAGFFSHAEYRALLAALPAHVKPVLAFAYHTGCRKSEILGLRWGQVDLAERVVRLNPGETKNNEPREIPLVGDLHAMLAAMLRERDRRWPDCPWVFARYGKPVQDFRTAWERSSRRAADSVPSLWDSERKRPAKLFHDLRRTGARNLVRAGVPEAVVMKIGGWKTRSVFDRYNVVSSHDLRNAASALETYLGGLAAATRPKQVQKRKRAKS